MRALGNSLGDIAGFMHEVEVTRGWLETSITTDRGMQNIREMGVRLQQLGQGRKQVSVVSTDDGSSCMSEPVHSRSLRLRRRQKHKYNGMYRKCIVV
jgi:hypothetical protein